MHIRGCSHSLCMVSLTWAGLSYLGCQSTPTPIKDRGIGATRNALRTPARDASRYTPIPHATAATVTRPAACHPEKVRDFPPRWAGGPPVLVYSDGMVRQMNRQNSERCISKVFLLRGPRKCYSSHESRRSVSRGLSLHPGWVGD
jgi:hypothetical protein